MLVRDKYLFPPDLYYDGATHVWVRHDDRGGVTGLDALALESFGDIAYVTLSAPGAVVKRGQPMGTIEAAKMVDELLAPISGTIVARNDNALSNPGLISDDGYGDGWLAIIAPSDWDAEAAQLVHGSALAAWVEAEADRLGE